MSQYLRLEEIKLTLNEDESILGDKIQKILQIPKEGIISYKIIKKSIDSRDKANILFIYSVDVDLNDKNVNILKPNPVKHRAKFVEEYIYEIKQVSEGTEKKRPIIVGTGPAGLFAGLALAKAGLKPLIIERGKAVE